MAVAVWLLVMGVALASCSAPRQEAAQPPPSQTAPSASPGQPAQPSQTAGPAPQQPALPAPGAGPAAPPPPAGKTFPVSVHFLAVGQGDSVLIQTASGESVLVDGGPRDAGPVVVRYLKDRG
ncbi:MAG: hypothetical protein H5U04_12325 [Firmicutes bacterium]|nr:hypothetical protein [Bacillota bacterium]